MKAYEFPAKVTPEGRLEFPESLLQHLPSNQQVRVIILVGEPTAIGRRGSCKAIALQQNNSSLTTAMLMLYTIKFDLWTIIQSREVVLVEFLFKLTIVNLSSPSQLRSRSQLSPVVDHKNCF